MSPELKADGLKVDGMRFALCSLPFLICVCPWLIFLSALRYAPCALLCPSRRESAVSNSLRCCRLGAKNFVEVVLFNIQSVEI